MRTRGSNRNLKKANAEAKNRDAPAATPEVNSWQPRILSVEGPRQNCWLVNSAVDVHVCNDRLLMTEYREHSTKVGGSTFNGVSPRRGKIQLRLGLENNSEGLILNLQNVYYLPNSPCNLVNLGLLNNSGIYHDNKHENLYQIGSRKVLAQAKRWRNSFLLKPLNLSDGAVHLLRVDADTYQPPHALRMSASLLPSPFSIWHKHLGHLNFSSLKTHLNRLNIKYDDS